MARQMKDSGVEWIGQIPEDWEIVRIKQLFAEVDERCTKGNEYTLLSVSEYYGVSPKKDHLNEDDMLTRAETLDGKRFVKGVFNIKNMISHSTSSITSQAICLNKIEWSLNRRN